MAAVEITCEVQKLDWITPTVFQITFTPPQSSSFTAGQFLSVVVPASALNPKDLRRAYSIASAPENPAFELCVKIVEKGPGTTYLSQLNTGDKLRLFVPYGAFTFKTLPERNAMFIATGTGIAPFRSMALSKSFQEKSPKKTTVVLGVREENEILYESLFKGLPQFEFVAAVSRPSSNWNGFKGRVTDYLRALPQDYPWSSTDFYLCGNSGMIDEVKAILTERKVEKTAIHQEVYYKDPK